MRTILCAIAAAFIAVAGSQASANIGRNETEICNTSSSTVEFFLATKRGFGVFAKSWEVGGPYTVRTGQCRMLLTRGSLGMEVLVGAKTKGWFGSSSPARMQWRTNDRRRDLGSSRTSQVFCVSDKKFKYTLRSLPSGARCSSGQEALPFFARFFVPADQSYGRFVNRIEFR